MDFTAYVIDGHQVDIRPASVDRVWMDETGDRFAYRCLPLAIANAHGWEIGCRSGFTAVWDGTKKQQAIRILADEGTVAPAISHFGSGVLTFHIPCIFRTPPGYDLWVQGPVNRPKDAIAALQAVIETDWAPYSFTMNWLFTRPGAEVRFEAGEPFCHVFPVRRGEVEAFAPAVRPLSADPDLQEQHRLWAESRSTFNKDLRQEGSDARAAKWQKLYYRGLDVHGQEGAPDHRTRVRVKPFKAP